LTVRFLSLYPTLQQALPMETRGRAALVLLRLYGKLFKDHTLFAARLRIFWRKAGTKVRQDFLLAKYFYLFLQFSLKKV